MKEKIRLTKNELLAYVDKKCGSIISSSLQKYIEDLRSVTSDKHLLELQSELFAKLESVRKVEIIIKKRYSIIKIDERTFYTYYDRNKNGNLFFVLDYKKRGTYHYFYLKIDNNINVTVFE